MYCKSKGNVKPCLNGYNTLYYLLLKVNICNQGNIL